MIGAKRDTLMLVITIEELTNRVETLFPQLIDDLRELVAIPSVSSPAFDQNEVERSAKAVAALLENLGMQVETLRAKDPEGNVGRPAIVATRHDHPGAPTVLLYAHHDVQPVGDLALWDQADPFAAEERDGRLYGRGAADDKAGVLAHVGALRALGADLPVNVTCFIEGEEEIGSPTFADFLATYHDKLASDVIIVADSSNWQVGIPALTTSLRGLVDITVEVKVGSHAVHSGIYGGPYLDALTLMSRLIATLHDENGDVAVAGLHHGEPSQLEYPEAQWRAEAGVVDSYQLAGTGTLPSRLWAKPAINVIGIDATSVSHKSNTIAPTCRAALSMRIPAGQDPQAAADAVKAHLEANAPFGAEVNVQINELGEPFAGDTDGEAGSVAHWALAQAFGCEAVDIGLGASIPFIAVLEQQFPEAAILVTGVEDPDTRAHSANESLHLGDFKSAVLSEALMLAKWGKAIEA